MRSFIDHFLSKKILLRT